MEVKTLAKKTCHDMEENVYRAYYLACFLESSMLWYSIASDQVNMDEDTALGMTELSKAIKTEVARLNNYFTEK